MYMMEVAIASSRLERNEGLFCEGSRVRVCSEQSEDTRQQIADQTKFHNIISMSSTDTS